MSFAFEARLGNVCREHNPGRQRRRVRDLVLGDPAKQRVVLLSYQPVHKPLKRWGLGVLFVGDKGMLAANYGSYHLLPKDKFPNFPPRKKTIPRSIGHWNEWVKACKTGSPTTCNFDYSGALTESVLLGVVAFRTGEKLQWDAKNLKATNSSAAGEYIRKEYRLGWELAR